MNRFILVFTSALALLVSCDDPFPMDNTDAGADQVDQDRSDADAAVAPLTEFALANDYGPVDLEGGVEIPALCSQWTLNNEQPIYVNRVTLSNGGAFHHSNWFAVPDTSLPGEDGYFDCDERGFDQVTAAVQGTVLFAQSTQSLIESQDFPEGVVIKIPPGYKIIGSLHLLNLSPQPVETFHRMQLDLIHPKQVEVVVAPLRLSYFALNIPPEGQSRFTGSCNLAPAYERESDGDYDLKLYWVLPHYHGLGNYFRLDIKGGPRDGENLFELSGFNAEANGQAYEPAVDLTGSEGLTFTCGYNNPRDVPVGWGIGDQEMCMMLAFVDADLLLDVAVRSNTVDGEENGITQNSGPCLIIPLPKNENQSLPTREEVEDLLYVPDTGAPSDQVGVEVECADQPEGAIPSLPPTTASVQNNIFKVSCAFNACHDSENPAFGLDLTRGDIGSMLQTAIPRGNPDQKYVVAGNPEESWLYQTMSKCEPGHGVTAMPKNGQTLMNPELVATVREWIENGAL